MNDNERVELNELISALIDQRASASEQKRLEEMLAASDEARRFYVRTMSMSASLCEYAAEMQSEAPEPVNVIRVQSWRRWVAPLAAAAVVALGVWLGRVVLTSGDSVNGEEAQETVARLSGSKDCKWTNAAPSPGDELLRGRRLELQSGVAELTFDSGAQLTLVGPAVLDLHSAWEAELHRGTLKANVPPEAVGFRVTNASVEVVDLGTEFSMTAEGDAAEVFVHKGAVEVHPRVESERRGSVLREKQARRFAKAGESDVRDTERKFQRYGAKLVVERLAHPLNYVQWSFDEGKGSVANPKSNAGEGTPIQFASSEGSPWIDGRWGKAVRLDRVAPTMAQLAGDSARGIRSVACWVRMPSSSEPSAAAPLLAFPLNRNPQGWAELSWNDLPGEGVLGALRMRSSGGTTVGTTSLRDGKWHHVAAIFGQPAKSTPKPHVKLYIDGRLESLSMRTPGRKSMEQAPVGLANALLLGGNAAGRAGVPVEIDEVFVADRQMTPLEIRYLMRTNQLVSPESLASN